MTRGCADGDGRRVPTGSEDAVAGALLGARSRVRRGRVLSVGLVGMLTLGCLGAPMHAEGPYADSHVHSPYPYPDRTAQGALLGGMAGAAIGAGLDHHRRARGALIGGLGGLIVGAVFGEQLERHAAWHRTHDAPTPDRCHEHAWPEDCPHGRPDAHDDHTWHDDGYADDEPPWDRERERGWDREPVPHEFAYAAPEVLFDPGSATLSRGAEARLRDLAQRLRGRGDVEVLLRGHSDELERDGFELSEARARAVRAFLTEQGLSVRRIAWVGFGDAQPIASNETAVGRQRNRRVEIVLREPDVDPYS